MKKPVAKDPATGDGPIKAAKNVVSRLAARLDGPPEVKVVNRLKTEQVRIWKQDELEEALGGRAKIHRTKLSEKGDL